MSKPYTDEVKGRFKTRTFESNTDSHELVWHRDKADRIVTVLEGSGWFFQMDNNIPIELEEGDVLTIPKMEYHRIYKAGNTKLVLEIEEPKVKSFKQHIKEEQELEEIFGSIPFKIDTLAWSASHKGQKPKGNGDWKFSYKVPVKNPSISYIDDGEFSFKGKFKDAVKKLSDYLKKTAPRGTVIKQAMVKLEK